MTELSFLISLILDDELPAKHKKMIAERIQEAEKNLTAVTTNNVPRGTSIRAQIEGPPPDPAVANGHVPAHMAQSPVTAMALQSRQQAIAQSASGNMKPPPGQSGPRKF